MYYGVDIIILVGIGGPIYIYIYTSIYIGAEHYHLLATPLTSILDQSPFRLGKRNKKKIHRDRILVRCDSNSILIQ